MPGRRAISGLAGALALLVACIPVARAQPAQQDPPPPVVDSAPPPPVVQNVAPPPVVPNVAPGPPVVPNVAPGPAVVPNVAPGPPVVHNVAPGPPVVQPVPAEPVPEPEGTGGSGKLFLSGLGTFVLAYGLTVLLGAIATATDDPAGETLYVPVIGPLLFWDGTNTRVDAEGGGTLILSVVFQTVGIAGMLAGLVEIGGAGEPSN